MRRKGVAALPGCREAAGEPAVGLWLGRRDLSGCPPWAGGCWGREHSGCDFLQVMEKRGCTARQLSPLGFSSLGLGVAGGMSGGERLCCEHPPFCWVGWLYPPPQPAGSKRGCEKPSRQGENQAGSLALPLTAAAPVGPPGWRDLPWAGTTRLPPPAPAAPALADSHLQTPGSGSRRLPAELAIVLEPFAK